MREAFGLTLIPSCRPGVKLNEIALKGQHVTARGFNPWLMMPAHIQSLPLPVRQAGAESEIEARIYSPAINDVAVSRLH
ncbi:hypothetical protein [Shivajiella indica]|uniref:Uncharacterized protein n=1 Tax=Shivajiella indica TaxID=872115 RepID=A0ABW5BC79_9BACT